MKFAGYIFVISAFFLVYAPPSHAQLLQKKEKTKILLNADFIERDNEKDITILRDNVQIILEQNFISCNEAVIIWSKNEIVAVGNVLLKTPKSDIQGDKIIYNFQDEKGKIFNGLILSGKVLLQSEYIEKTGPDTYKADSAYFTSCTTCPASWSFTVDNVEATIEGYAYLSSPWLNILEFPAIYMPYLIIPLKNERQTGLLTPTFDVSSLGGVAVEIPYFWAISRSQDMTFGLKMYEKRGLQGVFNYRYRLSEKSSGELSTAFLRDKAVGYKNRWFTSYSHYLELPQNYVQRSTIHLASDSFYTRDFQIQFPYAGEPALDNRTSLTKNFPDYHLSIDSSYYMSLIQNSFEESKESSVHRIPEVRFSITDKKISSDPPLFFRLDTQYVNFARQGLGFDSPVNPADLNAGYRPISTTGVFDPLTDKVRTGQRLDFQPRIYSPWRLFNKRLDVTPYLAYRHTQYVLGALNETQNFDFFPHRNYATMGVNTSTEISGIYGSSSPGTKYRHSVIPEVNFQSIPWFYQTNHPFFGTQDQIPFFLQTQPLQDLDLQPGGRGLQFDYEDRLIGRRLMNLAITNRVTRKSDTPIGSQYDQPFLFSLSQAYDFIEAKKDNGLPWQDIRGLMNVRWGKADIFTEAFHFPYHKVTNVSSRLRFNLIDINYFEVIYSNYLNVPARPADVNANSRQETLLFNVGLRHAYASISGQVDYSLKDDRFTRWMITTEIIPPGRCWTISANIFKTLAFQGNEENFGGTAMINFKFGD